MRIKRKRWRKCDFFCSSPHLRWSCWLENHPNDSWGCNRSRHNDWSDCLDEFNSLLSHLVPNTFFPGSSWSSSLFLFLSPSVHPIPSLLILTWILSPFLRVKLFVSSSFHPRKPPTRSTVINIHRLYPFWLLEALSERGDVKRTIDESEGHVYASHPCWLTTFPRTASSQRREVRENETRFRE